MAASFYMAIKKPKNFTFDKEAHLKVPLDESPADVPGVFAFVRLLSNHAGDAGAIERLADLIKRAEENEAANRPKLVDPANGVQEEPPQAAAG